jgi:hypothetical protein
LILAILKSDPNIISYISFASLLLYSTTFSQKQLKKLKKWITVAIFIQVAIALFQLTFQASTNLELLHFFGEPSLHSSTKGISKINLSNFTILRPYGTTNHPNLLAGLILLLATINKNQIISSLGLISTFSISGISAALLSKIKNNWQSYILILFLVLTILLKLISTNYTGISDRVGEYTFFFKTKILDLNIFFGDNYISQQPTTLKLLPWQITPIHNHLLYIIQYYGLIGLLVISTMLKPYYKKLFFLAPIILLDHYFLTLSNGLLLFALFLIFCNEKTSIASQKI